MQKVHDQVQVDLLVITTQIVLLLRAALLQVVSLPLFQKQIIVNEYVFVLFLMSKWKQFYKFGRKQSGYWHINPGVLVEEKIPDGGECVVLQPKQLQPGTLPVRLKKRKEKT